jgi:hypothetical protein
LSPQQTLGVLQKGLAAVVVQMLLLWPYHQHQQQQRP